MEPSQRASQPVGRAAFPRPFLILDVLLPWLEGRHFFPQTKTQTTSILSHAQPHAVNDPLRLSALGLNPYSPNIVIGLAERHRIQDWCEDGGIRSRRHPTYAAPSSAVACTCKKKPPFTRIRNLHATNGVLCLYGGREARQNLLSRSNARGRGRTRNPAR